VAAFRQGLQRLWQDGLQTPKPAAHASLVRRAAAVAGDPRLARRRRCSLQKTRRLHPRCALHSDAALVPSSAAPAACSARGRCASLPADVWATLRSRDMGANKQIFDAGHCRLSELDQCHSACCGRCQHPSRSAPPPWTSSWRRRRSPFSVRFSCFHTRHAWSRCFTTFVPCNRCCGAVYEAARYFLISSVTSSAHPLHDVQSVTVSGSNQPCA
jgi:hypothetical protein